MFHHLRWLGAQKREGRYPTTRTCTRVSSCRRRFSAYIIYQTLSYIMLLLYCFVLHCICLYTYICIYSLQYYSCYIYTYIFRRSSLMVRVSEVALICLSLWNRVSGCAQGLLGQRLGRRRPWFIGSLSICTYIYIYII